MPTFEFRTSIDAPVDKVWSILADFGGVYRYSPGVRSSHTTSTNPQGVGASRHCDLKPAGFLEERILEWNENESYSLEIYDGKGAPPFKRAIATFSVEPSDSSSIVTAKVRYKLKYGPIGALMDRLVVGSFLRKGLSGTLDGLKHYAETGEEVTSARGRSAAAQSA